MLKTILVHMGEKIQMWSPDCEMKKLSLSLPPAFSGKEDWLIFISSWRTAQCRGVQKTPSNLINLSTVTSWQHCKGYMGPSNKSLHTPHSYSSGKQMWRKHIRGKTGLKEQRRKEGEKRDGKICLWTQEAKEEIVNPLCVPTSNVTTWPFTLWGPSFLSYMSGSHESHSLL